MLAELNGVLSTESIWHQHRDSRIHGDASKDTVLHFVSCFYELLTDWLYLEMGGRTNNNENICSMVAFLII